MSKQISLTFDEITTKTKPDKPAASKSEPPIKLPPMFPPQTAAAFFAEFDEAAKCFRVVMMVFRKEFKNLDGFAVHVYFEEHEFFLMDPSDFTWGEETLERFAGEEKQRKRRKEMWRPHAIELLTKELAGGEWGKFEAMGLICLALNEEEEDEEELDVWTFPFMRLECEANKTPAFSECIQFLRDVEEAMRFTAFTKKAWFDGERYLHLYRNGRKDGFRYSVQVVR